MIEDDLVIARTVASSLRDEGFRVEIARGLAEARGALRRGGFSCVVVDLDLPDGAGELLLRDIARSEAGIAAVVMSAREYAPRVGSRWAIPVVRKPFELDELIAAVKVALDARLVPRPMRVSIL